MPNLHKINDGTVIEPKIIMRKLRFRTITLLIGILVAISAISLGIGLSQSHSISMINSGPDVPSVKLIDMNKVFYIFFNK